MKLLTKEIKRTLPPLYATQADPDPMVRVKFFTPDGDFTWYVTEYDGQDTCFGLFTASSMETELGYFSLSEISAVRGSLGLSVERDKSFTPCPLSQVKRSEAIEIDPLP